MEKTSIQHRRYFTANERAEWISRYRASGLSQRGFVQQHGLVLGTFQQWLYREHRRTSANIRPIRTTAAQRARVIERFQGSGLTRRAFARKSGIALSSLNRWLAQAKSTAKAPFPVRFRELKLPPLLAAPALGWAMEIVSPQGLTLRCREPIEVQDLMFLLRGGSC
jgi:lambda repressor-like predicted transcriptional regulator